jgi:methylphosphotriester-DNA--protein-cysteine methyltransferase
MPRQNRVTPFGEIIATPERGMLMGNRGVIHDRDGRIRRNWLLKRWIFCVLEFKGRQRIVMTEGRYTELFFLDEATALAAGHRPCAECQRTRYVAYRDAWDIGNRSSRASAHPSALEIDDRLHADRLDHSRRKRTFLKELGDLPDGVFIRREERKDQALLVRGDSLVAWSPGGYRERSRRRNSEIVMVLTPESSIAAILAGFVPGVHPSAAVA